VLLCDELVAYIARDPAEQRLFWSAPTLDVGILGFGSDTLRCGIHTALGHGWGISCDMTLSMAVAGTVEADFARAALSEVPPCPMLANMDALKAVENAFFLYQNDSPIRLRGAQQVRDCVLLSIEGRHSIVPEMFDVLVPIPMSPEDPEWSVYPVETIDEWAQYAAFYRIVELYDTSSLPNERRTAPKHYPTYIIERKRA
jgi:hypothetical protein